MYGFQGNNSQSYNYQNPNGSFGNISQYAGSYHPFYSNATAPYNAFPSNEPPCSSLGMIPQEYSQAGNGIPRPYFYDTNSSYPRPYQSLPFNQSMDLPIANSYSTCPRNCHCCEPLKPKYFNSSSAVPQQASVKNSYDPTLNAAYNGLRKSFDGSTWRECNPQMQNLKDANDSATSWTIPKYGNGFKTETCPWPLPPRQTTKFESGERMTSANNYILSQQHQRIPLPNSQTLSSVHSNSLRTMPTTCPSPGRNEDLLGSSLVGYQCGTFSDLPQSNVESHSYPKSSVNSVQTSSRTACNLPYGSSFTCRYSTSTSQIINENQKCAVETPTVIAPLSGNLVDSFQRRFATNAVREEVKDNSYYQPGALPSANSVNAPTRRVFNTPKESDTTFRLNCNSNESINPVATSRLQLPPIQSLRPSSMLFRHSSREHNQDHSHHVPKSGHQNLIEESGTRMRKSTSLAYAPVRNIALNTTDKYCNSTQPEYFNKTLSGNGNNSNFLNPVYGNQYMEEQGKNSLTNSGLTEGSSKSNLVKHSHSKISTSNISSGISDLRHFLSTWDDVDDEDMPSSTQEVVSDGSKANIELISEDISVAAEYPPHVRKQLEDSSCSSKTDGAMPVPDARQNEFPFKGVIYPVDPPPQFIDHHFESDSFVKSTNLKETEITEYKSNTSLKNDLREKKEITSQYQAKRSFSYSELSACGDLRDCASSVRPMKSLETDSRSCMSFLDLNSSESQVGYIETKKVPSEERILETLNKKKEYSELLHSSDGKSLKILSLDLAVQGSTSISQNKSNTYKIQSNMEDPKKDIPVIQKTFTSCDSKSEGKKLDHQNGTIKETDNKSAMQSSENGSMGTSNKAKSESIPLESDTMVFYNLTARVDVTLERLEVPSISVNERNDYSAHILMSNGQTKKAKALEPNNIDLSESKSSEMNQTNQKENEEGTYISSDKDEVHPPVIEATDHEFKRVQGLNSDSASNESISKTDTSVIDSNTKNTCLTLPPIVGKCSIDKQVVELALDHCNQRGSLLGSNEIHDSMNGNVLPVRQKVPEIPVIERDENHGSPLASVETGNFKGAELIPEVKSISAVDTNDADEHERTSQCSSEICEFKKVEVTEISNEVVSEISLDNNEINYDDEEETFDKAKDTVKLPHKEPSENKICSLECNKIQHSELHAPHTELISVSEMPSKEDKTDSNSLADDMAVNVKGAETTTEVKDITEMSTEEADLREKDLGSNEICSSKDTELLGKVNRVSESPVEILNELGESFIEDSLVQNFKGSTESNECLDVSGRRKEADKLSCKILQNKISCRKRKAINLVSKSKDGKKISRTPSKKLTSKVFKKTTCKVILSLKKKYHFFHLSKDKKKSCPGIICKIRSTKNIKSKRSSGKSNLLKNGAVDSCITNSKDVLMVSDESKNVVTDVDILNSCVEITEDVKALPANSCFSEKIIEHEGLTSSHCLSCRDNDGEAAEGSGDNVILNVEEKEIVLEGLEENCVIGNVEVFMGIEGGEGSTMEESGKESSFALGPPIEELLEEDTVGVQYWNSYELDNSLGVAMEVEVGSEIENDAEMILLDHVKVEDLADSESNNQSVSLVEKNLDHELLEAPSSVNEFGNKKTDLVVSLKKEIGALPNKGDIDEKIISSLENGKSIYFCEKEIINFSDTTEVKNGTDIKLENGVILDNVESTLIPLPSKSFTTVPENDSKLDQDTSFLPSTIDDESETLEMKSKEPDKGRPYKTKNEFTFQNLKRNSFNINKGSHSPSNLRQFQHNAKKKRKTLIEKDGITNMKSLKLCSSNLSERKTTLVKNGSSAHFCTNKMKVLHAKKKRSVARIKMESHGMCIVPIEETVVDGFSVKKEKSCEVSSSEVYSAKVDEDEVKVNVSNITSKCGVFEGAMHACSKISESDFEKNATCYIEDHEVYKLPSKEEKNGLLSPCAESSENNQPENLQLENDDSLTAQGKIKLFTKEVVSKQREKEEIGSSGCLMELKEKGRKDFRFSSRPAINNISILHSHLHKSARHGFWKARKWPYHCMHNKKKPLKKLSKTSGVPVFSDQEKNALPLILSSYPHPPFLSPLPAYTDSLPSDTHNLSFTPSKSSSENESCEKLSLSIQDQGSEELRPIVQTKNESAHTSLHISENSNKSGSPSPVIDSDSSKITNIQYLMPYSTAKCMSREQNMSASPKSEAELTEETENVGCGKLRYASPHRLKENDFSVSSNQSLGTEYLSNENPNPRVCITFKKVGIADKNEKWMKTSIQDEFSGNQEVRKDQFIKNRSDYSFESPLPKVTIKKKNGEGGYQSFLSGYSYSPLPSSPITPTPHILIPPKSEDIDAEELQDVTQDSCYTQGTKSKSVQTTVALKSNANAGGVQEVSPKRNSPGADEVQSGILEKKAGSGLVFVIRGLGNHVKEDHPKKPVVNKTDVSCKQMETSINDGNPSQVSQNCLSSEDEGLESIPWSVWQPVVKLARSCELDALAREMCNTDEDSQIGDTSQHQHSSYSGSKVTQSSSQEAKIKSESDSLKPMKDSNNRKESDEGKDRLKRKDSEKMVEVEKKQSAPARNPTSEIPKKFAVVSHKPPKKLVLEKSFDAALQQIEKVVEKKMQLEKGKSSGNFKVLNESFKHVMCPNRSDSEEKNLIKSNLPVPISPVKIKSETNPVENKKEKMDVNVSLQKEKAKKSLTQEANSEIEELLDCIKDEPKNGVSGMKISKESSSCDRREWKDDLGRRRDVNILTEVQNGKNKVSSAMQDSQSIKSSMEKLSYISHYSEKDSTSVRRKRRRAPSFQCEACSRRFSSEKWLSRHCKGVSHTRVENAQRVAVQALLLLLTGDESKSLRPLSEIELANLKLWSSHSAPSPLQVALKELLHPAKDNIL